MKFRRPLAPSQPITWDERYSGKDYYYGIEPNIYFAQELKKRKPGKILLIAEGEGRNAVHAAREGWKADAIDNSIEGYNKAFALAHHFGVSVNYIVGNFFDHPFPENEYDAAGLIFFHVHVVQRARLFDKVRRLLKPGGVVICEVFEKDQLGKPSGGPKEIDMLYDFVSMMDLAEGMKVRHMAREVVKLNEGRGHLGEAVVMRLTAEKK